MGIPKVAIVGRPNVGKSSLLNWMSGKLISIVDPTAGVTRDRVTWLMHQQDRYFELVDTGGIGIVDSDDLSEDIEHQIDLGLSEAALILFVVDAKDGIMALDREVASRLRKVQTPVLLVVNKCDSTRLDSEAENFLSLLHAPMVVTSVKGNRNREELISEIVQRLPPADDDESTAGEEQLTDPELKLAIVGRRNVGKSTFINQLAQSDRVIVSEVPGTTRDSVDIRFELDEKTFVAIDTPGVRKRKSLANDIEFYGLVRAKRSIRRASVVLMFFDATETISRVDKQLVEEIDRHHKPCIFVVNKWDKGTEADMTTERWSEYLISAFASMRHVPIAFVTAIDGRNVKKLVNLTQSIYKQARQRVSTGKLNRILREAVFRNPPPMRRNRRPRVFFATQVATEPPTLVLKCNDPRLLDESWKRYLLGYLREKTPFQEVPIRVIWRAKSEDDSDVPHGRAGSHSRDSSYGHDDPEMSADDVSYDDSTVEVDDE